MVVRQEKGILSWKIPFFIKREDSKKYDQYTTVNRTLCPIENYPPIGNYNTAKKDVHIIVSTSSTKNVSFDLRLYKQETFEITDFKQSVSAEASPSTPIFFQVNLTEKTDVLIKFESDDEICAIVSVQNIACPVFDLDQNVQYEGFYQTVSTKAGITFTQDQFPLGIFLVVVVKPDDTSCHKSQSAANIMEDKRMKKFTLRIFKDFNQYLNATLGAIGVYLGIYLIVLIICVTTCIIDRVRSATEEPLNPEGESEIVSPDLDDCQSYDDIKVVTNQNAMDSVCPDDTDGNINAARNQTEITEEPLNPEGESKIESPDPDDCQVHDDIEVYGKQNDVDSVCPDDADRTQTGRITIAPDDFLTELRDQMSIDLDITDMDSLYLSKKSIYVSDLARMSPKRHAKKASLYKWNVITMAIFYGLPVIQLVITYQDVTNTTGNQDLCYYNFLCTNPFGFLSDFNHAFSNVGYVLLGILFICIVKRRSYNYQKLGLEHHRTMGKKHTLKKKT